MSLFLFMFLLLCRCRYYNVSTEFLQSQMREEHQHGPYFLREKLLEAVDKDYNVKDMPLILEVLGKLEVLAVSKEILETTRLGKTVNDFRRKVQDHVLAKRLKELVKKWRVVVIPHPVPVPGGNCVLPPNFSSGYTSASSSPTLGTVTNYNRNGSSSPNNHRNPQLVIPSASTASPSYAPNSETVSRTNAANKRYRELDHSPLRALNGTLDDPTLALDDISRDSYASRGSDHSDGFTSKDNRFSISAPSPATPGQASVLSPQMPVPGTDSSVPSPATSLDPETAITSHSELQPKRKRRKKQNEFFQDTEAILREKIAQAQAEKAAKAAREREMQLKEREAASNGATISTDMRRNLFDETLPEDKLTNNVIVEKYLKSQNELRAKMERDAIDALSGSDFQGAEGNNETSAEKLSKKEKKLKRKLEVSEDATDKASNDNSFLSEGEILAQLPPIDPELLKEFANFQYDVNPSPAPSENGAGDAFNSLNKETESVSNSKSLSSTEEKPRKVIDWGDSEDEEELEREKLRREREAEADLISQQVQAISEYVTDPTTELLTSVALSSEDKSRGSDLTFGVTSIQREVKDEEVEKYIKDDVPNLNGNYDKEGQFREWHETLTVESYKREPLHILPYTIIDF